jgi:two-component system response regulator HydG
LQEGEYEPLGGRTHKADFRLIAATNRDLKSEVEANRFREDLFYRLNVIAITCPTLSERNDDIPLLVDHFLAIYCRKNGKPAMSVTRAALERLTAYGWPGNVRELENVIERAVVLGRTATIDVDALPGPIAQAEARGGSLSFALGTPLEEIEQRVIRATLDHTGGDKRIAAQLLGIATRTIYRKLAAEGEEDEGPLASPAPKSH